MTTLRTSRVARTRGGLARELAVLRERGSVAFVPTMGALHEGHRALIRSARTLADAVVVSVFVNPLQFGPTEDLERYPRAFAADLAACREEGVALVFAPTEAVVYPRAPLVTVSAGSLGSVLEGASRPGHFDGVLTVVAKLFALVHPDVAVFGEKDAQQLILIRRMVSDLDLPVHVVGVPTVREPDGLARSSRNARLTPPERTAALALVRSLRAGAAASGEGAAAVRRAARAALESAEPGLACMHIDGEGRDGGRPSRRRLDVGPTAAGAYPRAQSSGLSVDYVALVDVADLAEVANDHDGPALLAVAAQVGGTRLIDNVTLTINGAR